MPGGITNASKKRHECNPRDVWLLTKRNNQLGQELGTLFKAEYEYGDTNLSLVPEPGVRWGVEDTALETQGFTGNPCSDLPTLKFIFRAQSNLEATEIMGLYPHSFTPWA